MKQNKQYGESPSPSTNLKAHPSRLVVSNLNVGCFNRFFFWNRAMWVLSTTIIKHIVDNPLNDENDIKQWYRCVYYKLTIETKFNSHYWMKFSLLNRGINKL